MRVLVCVGLLGFGMAASAAAQSSCSTGRVTSAAHAADTLREHLQAEAIPKTESAITPALSTGLLRWKDALTEAVQAVLACTPDASTPEALQTRLADELHANLPLAGESLTGRGNVYGTGLTVQVFELFGKPHIFEIDLRYALQCGDDHLLLVFQSGDPAPSTGWHEQLRWDTRQYRTVGDGLGDFVLLTPFTGSHEHPTWRYLVAHGHPSCEDTPHPSAFQLDLLRPSADPAAPALDWHFSDTYTAGEVSPRLATTETTIDLSLMRAAAAGKTPAAATDKVKQYRFHLSADGLIQPTPSSEQTNDSVPPLAPASTR